MEQPLNFSPKEIGLSVIIYENLKNDHFVKWCELHAKRNKVPVKALMYDTGLFSWFDSNWKKRIEERFTISFGAETSLISDRTCLVLFKQTIIDSELIKTYPSVLLEKAIQKFYGHNKQKNTAARKRKRKAAKYIRATHFPWNTATSN